MGFLGDVGLRDRISLLRLRRRRRRRVWRVRGRRWKGGRSSGAGVGDEEGKGWEWR